MPLLIDSMLHMPRIQTRVCLYAQRFNGNRIQVEVHLNVVASFGFVGPLHPAPSKHRQGCVDNLLIY